MFIITSWYAIVMRSKKQERNYGRWGKVLSAKQKNPVRYDIQFQTTQQDAGSNLIFSRRCLTYEGGRERKEAREGGRVIKRSLNKFWHRYILIPLTKIDNVLLSENNIVRVRAVDHWFSSSVPVNFHRVFEMSPSLQKSTRVNEGWGGASSVLLSTPARASNIRLLLRNEFL